MTARVLVKVVLMGAMVGLVACRPHFDKNVNLALAVHSPPPELQTIAERSQQIMTAVADSNWPHVHAYVKDIDAAWQQFKYPAATSLSNPQPPAVLFRGPLDGAINRLRSMAGKEQARETVEAASQIDQATLRFFGYYAPTVPLGLRTIRVLEGQTMLQAIENRFDLASKSLAEIRDLWIGIRPIVEARSSSDVVAMFEDCLMAQQAALDQRNQNALAASARQALDRIDETMQRVAYEERREESIKSEKDVG